MLAAYAGATVVDGDAFLVAFAAEFGVVLLNQILCDCFLEFGETIFEMAMLLSFVFFGIVISESSVRPLSAQHLSRPRWWCS